MKKRVFVLAAMAWSAQAFAQTNIGEVSISQNGTENNVDAVCTGTVTANAGSGTFVVGDGAGALNTIVDSGSLTCNAGTNLNTSALSTSANQTTIIGHVDGIEGSLTTLTGTVSGSEQQVDIVSSALPTGASTLAEQQTQTTNQATIAGDTTDIEAAVEIMDDWDNGASDGASVSGDVANDAADAGEPVKVGGKAFSWGTGQTAVAANDRVNQVFSRDGVAFVQPGAPHSIFVEYLWTTAQTNDPLVTVSSGTRIVVTGYQIQISSPTTVATTVRCGFGTATLAAAPSDGATGVGAWVSIDVVPGAGANNPPGFLVVGADDEDLRCTTSAPTTGTGRMMVFYYLTAN